MTQAQIDRIKDLEAQVAAQQIRINEGGEALVKASEALVNAEVRIRQLEGDVEKLADESALKAQAAAAFSIMHTAILLPLGPEMDDPQELLGRIEVALMLHGARRDSAFLKAATFGLLQILGEERARIFQTMTAIDKARNIHGDADAGLTCTFCTSMRNANRLHGSRDMLLSKAPMHLLGVLSNKFMDPKTAPDSEDPEVTAAIDEGFTTSLNALKFVMSLLPSRLAAMVMMYGGAEGITSDAFGSTPNPLAAMLNKISENMNPDRNVRVLTADKGDVRAALSKLLGVELSDVEVVDLGAEAQQIEADNG